MLTSISTLGLSLLSWERVKKREGRRTMDETGIFHARPPSFLRCELGFVIALGGSNFVIVHILVTLFSKPIKTSTKHVG